MRKRINYVTTLIVNPGLTAVELWYNAKNNFMIDHKLNVIQTHMEYYFFWYWV